MELIPRSFGRVDVVQLGLASIRIPSSIPPIEIPKVWWCYIFVLCGYQPRYRGTFGHRGIGFGGESSQIWRQSISETVGISTYRQTPSTLFD